MERRIKTAHKNLVCSRWRHIKRESHWQTLTLNRRFNRRVDCLNHAFWFGSVSDKHVYCRSRQINAAEPFGFAFWTFFVCFSYFETFKAVADFQTMTVVSWKKAEGARRRPKMYIKIEKQL